MGKKDILRKELILLSELVEKIDKLENKIEGIEVALNVSVKAKPKTTTKKTSSTTTKKSSEDSENSKPTTEN